MVDPSWFSVDFWQRVVIQSFAIFGALAVGLIGLQIQFNRERRRRVEDAKRARLVPKVDSVLVAINGSLEELSEKDVRTGLTVVEDLQVITRLLGKLKEQITSISDTEVYNYLSRLIMLLHGAASYLSNDVVSPVLVDSQNGIRPLTEKERARYNELASDVWKVLRSVFTAVDLWEQGGPFNFLYTVDWEKRHRPLKLWGDPDGDKRDIKKLKKIQKLEREAPDGFFTTDEYPPLPSMPTFVTTPAVRESRRQEWAKWFKSRPKMRS